MEIGKLRCEPRKGAPKLVVPVEAGQILPHL